MLASGVAGAKVLMKKQLIANLNFIFIRAAKTIRIRSVALTQHLIPFTPLLVFHSLIADNFLSFLTQHCSIRNSYSVEFQQFQKRSQLVDHCKCVTSGPDRSCAGDLRTEIPHSS